MPRRGKGEGSIRKRKDGRWEGALTVGITFNGWPRRVSVYGKTRHEVAIKLAELAAKYHKGLFHEPQAITVEEWTSTWLSRKALEVRPRTVQMYQSELALAMATVGAMRLQAVQPAHIRAILDTLAVRYSPRTVRMVRQRLHQLFEEAVNLELVGRNPVAPVKVRNVNRPRVGTSLQPDQARQLLEALANHPDARTALAIRLMLTLGLRKGEALGLQWDDIDFEQRKLTIRRTIRYGQASAPKTSSSQRSIPLPSDLTFLMQQYRASLDLPGVVWVFPGNDPNRPLDYNAVNHALNRICDRLGLPRIRVHDLRHSYGSLMLSKGAPVEVVAQRMGHANPNITLSVYRHLLEHENQQWVLTLDDLVTE